MKHAGPMKHADPVDAEAPYLELLRGGKVKITPNRRKVLAMFLAGDNPWTLQSLHRSLSEEADCEISSIYRALSAFREAGLLEEFRLPGEKQTYYSLNRHHGAPPPKPPHSGARAKTRNHGDHHHHHIVCQDCGIISHLDICLPAGVMGKVENASGFRITEHHLEFKGVCGGCRR